jgi:hypothetical protein
MPVINAFLGRAPGRLAGHCGTGARPSGGSEPESRLAGSNESSSSDSPITESSGMINLKEFQVQVHAALTRDQARETQATVSGSRSPLNRLSRDQVAESPQASLAGDSELTGRLRMISHG